MTISRASMLASLTALLLACGGGETNTTSGTTATGGQGGAGGSGGTGGAPPVPCGDGMIIAGEACDDGNTTAGDGCSPTCQIEPGFACTTEGAISICRPICGDGMTVGTEGCDDGNNTSFDGCNSHCEAELGYTCSGNPSTCTTTCGDAVVAGLEICDDGNTAGGDGCDAQCAAVETGYTCVGNPSVCGPTCGDDLLVPGEQCEDGNAVDGDGCSQQCKFEATCGNGIVEPGEQCDSGDPLGDLDCDASCNLLPGSFCGNSIDLNDPAKVTINGNVTTYDGTTVGSPIKNFGNPDCEASQNQGAVDVPSVVHRYRVGAQAATLAVETVNIGGALDDTLVWAYTDCFDHSVELGCDDDTGPGNYSLMALNVPAGTTIYIVVAGFYAVDVGPYRLKITEFIQ